MNSQKRVIKVAHITNVVDGRSNSGTARVAIELISQLALRDDVEQTFIHFKKSHEAIYQLPGAREIVIPIKKFPFASHFFSFLIFWVPRYFSLRQDSFDVVHWHSSRVFPLFFLIRSKKVCVTLHDANNRIIRGVNTFWTRLFYWNLRLSVGQVDFIFGVSHDACSKLINIARFPEEKVRCLYMASNFENVRPKKLEKVNLKPGYIICVSRWQPFKNVETLVEAYSLLVKESMVPPKLVLVGKPVAGYDLPLRRIEELSLEDYVLILKDLTDNEIAYLFREALVNVFPSLHEGFGLSVLEGLKCGCPSIDHVFTSTSEISGNAGIHVDMNSAELLSKAISSLLDNPILLAKLKHESAKRSQNFTWEKTVEELVVYYKS